MTGIRGLKVLGLFIGLPLTCFLFGDTILKTPSVADCTFHNDPDRFVAPERRVRRALNDRLTAMTRAFKRDAVAPVAKADSIPQRGFIDQEIFGKLIQMNVPSAQLSSDTEFVRRITLDLTGRIPSSDDVRAFLADSTPNKRDMLIEKLLYSSEFSDRWTMWAGDLLQNTATLNSVNFNRNIQGRNVFYYYIQSAIYDEKPFDQIATEVITGRGNNYDWGTAAANFPMAGSTAMGPIQDTYDNMMVKSATTFLGETYYDCLGCHDGRGHLDGINLWASQTRRSDAWGMAAFFSRTRFNRYPEDAPKPGQAASYMYLSYDVEDAATGTYDLNTTYGNRPNRTKVGSIVNLTPTYRTGATPKDGNWRAAFAANLVADPLFSRNLVNRIWKQMFGLALVDPVDTMDPARLDASNPPPDPWTLQPTHPALLDQLANEFVRQGYQLRPLLRMIAQSSAYQLSSHYDDTWSVNYIPLFARHYPRRMEGEEAHDAITKATAMPGAYAVQYFGDQKIAWAMQLPDPLEPRGNEGNANVFMSTFFRGNRDNLQRNQSGSIQQQLYLMNDQFVTNRVKVAASPKLKSMTQIPSDSDLIDEAFLTFLSRYPTDSERSIALPFMAQAKTAALRSTAVEDLAWVCINKVDFLLSY
jgi:Protein of unknown function (DUF1553)/Protein of unknown function (DUF1549)